MEQNKLETQFKEKLKSREIKPTEMAWDRLDAMLTVAELSDSGQVHKPKRVFNWLYIAASFIGFLLIATVFFNKKENIPNIKKNTVVIENTIPKESSKTEIKSIKMQPNFFKTIVRSETKPLVQTKKNIKSKVEDLTLKTQGNNVSDIQLNNQSELIVVNKNIIPENIDSLLASVVKTPQSGAKNSSVKINSSALLLQVDVELQVSFREKALNTITQKYKETKEALVNRNNQ